METNQINFNSDNFVFEGTAREFEENGIKLNGHFLDKVTVSNLAKHKIIETTGEGTKPARGRTPMKYKAVSREGMQFSFK